MRPRHALEQIRAWTRGETKMMESRAAGGHAMGAARELAGAARHAAYSAGQAACVAHVAAHELGAAAYAIKAARAAAPEDEEHAGLLECAWQREQLPERIYELVIDDQGLRNKICWSVFDGGERDRHRSAGTGAATPARAARNCARSVGCERGQRGTMTVCQARVGTG